MLVTFLVATALLLLVTMTLLAVVLLVKGNDHEQSTLTNVGTEDGGLQDSKDVSVGSAATFEIGLNTPATTKHGSGYAPSTPAVSVPSGPSRLLCTVHMGFDRNTFEFPPDGLCSIITFNSLFGPDGNTLQPPYKDDFVYFLDTAVEGVQTEYAIGIDHEDEAKVNNLVADPSTKTNLDSLWDQGVYHYAQVNTPAIQADNDVFEYITQSARGLQMISALMNDKKQESGSLPSYTILHYPLKSDEVAPDVLKALRGSPVDIFVAIAYVAYDDHNNPECRMVPPVIYSSYFLMPDQLDGLYGIRLDRVLSTLESMRDNWPSTTMIAVSIGMGARMYSPRYPDKLPDTPGNFSLGEQCKPTGRAEQIISITEVCENPIYKSPEFDGRYQSFYLYDKSKALMYAYETAATLRFKLCDTKREVQSLRYTIVADNIELADIHNACGYGEYGEVRMLEVLARFLVYSYSAPQDDAACKEVLYYEKK
ncbi:hypothetical protein HPB50_008677 [Hyalomma asiaticum]|uniref:Uncharacterized protein n=1 Tax=Hyalomma asiaticum TaxID=266040 RepID=A0ACB7SP55_HYAAI|nr:hypothetical protein HPB50_008677 [Hyalomma asiaticum]